jgi:hypothetical protein
MMIYYLKYYKENKKDTTVNKNHEKDSPICFYRPNRRGCVRTGIHLPGFAVGASFGRSRMSFSLIVKKPSRGMISSPQTKPTGGKR